MHEQVWERVRSLEGAAREELERQGFCPEDISSQAYLNLRFQGTDTALMTPASPPSTPLAQPAAEPGEGSGTDGVGRGYCQGSNEDSAALKTFFDQYR